MSKRVVTRGRVLAVAAMGAAVPLTLYAADELNVFEAGAVISSSEVNENFDLLDARIGVYDDTIAVDEMTGNIGIGTTNPLHKLHVMESDEETVQILGNSGTGKATLVLDAANGDAKGGDYLVVRQNDDLSADIWTAPAAGRLSLGAAGMSDMLTLATTGNVGIGTTAPEYALDVVGTVQADAFLEASDLRHKTNIAPLEGALDGIQCLEGVTYRLTDPAASPDVQIGLIAQDVERCFPEVVSTDEHGYKSVAYGRLVAPLIETVKEQQGRIERLEARLARLEALLHDGR